MIKYATIKKMLPHCFYIYSVQRLNQSIDFHKIWYIVFLSQMNTPKSHFSFPTISRIYMVGKHSFGVGNRLAETVYAVILL